NIFTIAKVSALAGLVLLGLFAGRNAQALAANFSGHFWQNAGLGAKHAIQVGMGGPTVWVGTLTILAVAQVGSLFSADAWNNVTFTAGEVRNPSRNLPLSLALGTGVVILLYVLCNLIYLTTLPLDGAPNGATILERGIKYASEERVGTAVMTQMLGSTGGALMAVAIMISTFGCCNGLILAGARVYYAMARDGLFFRSTGRLNARHVPAMALALQGVWTALLVLPRTRLRNPVTNAPVLDAAGVEQYGNLYGTLLDYVVFAVLIFYVLTIAGVFVLRRTQPQAERPYRAFGYPLLPAFYIVAATVILLVLAVYRTQTSWPGLLLVLAGVPVYFLWRKSRPT